MSSPSLPMVPQWLKLAFVVKRALGVLIAAEAVVPRQRTAGKGLKRETIAGNNPFVLHVMVHVLQGVKAKVPFPQFLTPTTSLVVEIPETSENTTCYAP